MMKIQSARSFSRIALFLPLYSLSSGFYKLLITIFITVVVAGNAHSQSDPIRLAIEEKHLDYMEGVTDADYIAVWGNVDVNITKFFLINRKTKHMATHRISSARYRFIGSISTPEEIKFYVQTRLPEGKPRIELLTFTKKGEYFQQKVLDREAYEAAFTQDGKFYRLAVDKKEDIVKVIISDGKGTDKTLTFSMEARKIQKLLTKQDFEFIQAGKAISYSEGQGLNKIYVRGDVIYLVSDAWEDDKADAVLVMALDANTGKADLKTIPLLQGDRTKHNSFLLEDQLFVFCFDHGDIILSIHQVKTGEQLKLLQYPKRTPIAFKSSDFMTDDVNREKEWWKQPLDIRLDRMIRTLDNRGEPFIMVESAPPNIRLIVGSLSEPRQRGGSAMMMEGGTASTPYGTMPSPGHVVFVGGYYGKAESHYFYGYLTSAGLDAASVPSQDTHGSVDAVKKRFINVSEKVKAGKSGVVYDGNTAMLVYIDRKAREMFIEKID